MLKNTGNYPAEEIVQLYIRDLVGNITRPVKELKGFKRVMLNPGEEQKVIFKIPSSELAFYNQNMEKVTEPGDYHLWISGCSDSNNFSSFTIE